MTQQPLTGRKQVNKTTGKQVHVRGAAVVCGPVSNRHPVLVVVDFCEKRLRERYVISLVGNKGGPPVR